MSDVFVREGTAKKFFHSFLAFNEGREDSNKNDKKLNCFENIHRNIQKKDSSEKLKNF